MAWSKTYVTTGDLIKDVITSQLDSAMSIIDSTHCPSNYTGFNTSTHSNNSHNSGNRGNSCANNGNYGSYLAGQYYPYYG